MKARFKVLYAPVGTSGGSSDSEPTPEQLQQQVADQSKTIESLQAENSTFKTRMENGELVSPSDALAAAVKEGTIYTKERYIGLQQTLQKEQEEKKKALEDADLLKTQVLGFETEKGSLASELETLKISTTEKDQKISKLETDLAVSNLIFKDFPELAGWKDFLPTGTLEELPTKFKAFSEKLGVVKEQGAREFTSGGGTTTPEGKTGKKPSTAEAFLKLANDAVLKGDTATYTENFEKYLAALKEENN